MKILNLFSVFLLNQRMHHTSLGKICYPRYCLRISIIFLYLFLESSNLISQEIPFYTFLIDYGTSGIHGPEINGHVLDIRICYTSGDCKKITYNAGFAIGSSDEGFLNVDFGPEFHPLAHQFISPFIGFGVGLLAETEYFGWLVKINSGIDANFKSFVIRFNIQRAKHGGKSGPHLMTVGLGINF